MRRRRLKKLWRRLRALAPGLTPRAVLEKLSAIQMVDVHLPTTDGRHIVLSRHTQPEPDQQLVLQRLKLTLPPQPPQPPKFWTWPGFVDTSLVWRKESTMPRTRAPYPSEFRQQMVELVRSGRSPEELARRYEPSAQAIRNWIAQADRDEGRRSDGLTSAEREELRRLKQENRQLRQEREILAKAAAWFARETGSIPSGSSSS